MIRQLIKTGIASTLHWTSVDNIFSKRTKIKQLPLVIGYHRIVEDFESASARSIPPMLTGVKTFERHLDWIGKRYQFITLDDLADWAEGKINYHQKQIAAITFDDGYQDLYQLAYPILKKKGIPASVFVVTERTSTRKLQIFDELYLMMSEVYSHWPDPKSDLLAIISAMGMRQTILNKFKEEANSQLRATWILLHSVQQAKIEILIQILRDVVNIPAEYLEEFQLMNWDMLREMSKSCITIGSHTRNHPLLTLENKQLIKDEIKESRIRAESELGLPVEHFAYPSGAFNNDVVSVVAEAGYRSAYTTCQHRDNRFPQLTIPRRMWWEKSCMDAFGRLSPAVMSCNVSGVFDFQKPCSYIHG